MGLMVRVSELIHKNVWVCHSMCLGDHVFMIGIACSVAMWLLIYKCIQEHGCV